MDNSWLLRSLYVPCEGQPRLCSNNSQVLSTTEQPRFSHQCAVAVTLIRQCTYSEHMVSCDVAVVNVRPRVIHPRGFYQRRSFPITVSTLSQYRTFPDDRSVRAHRSATVRLCSALCTLWAFYMFALRCITPRLVARSWEDCCGSRGSLSDG